MPDVTFSYQVLMKAVSASTDARGSVYPDDHNYVALPLSEVRSVVAEYEPEPWTSENSRYQDQARRLWCKLKQHKPSCACGIVRLLSPLPYDLIGIVTAEDLYGMDVGPSYTPPYMDEDMLSNDLSEIPEEPALISSSGQESPLDRFLDRHEPLERSSGQESNSSRVEMVLIDPPTKAIFKRSQGGVFGTGRWPISEIRAFAVWF